MSLPERHPWLLIVLPLLACWPVWQWMAERATDGSGDPWELLSLVTAVVFIGQRRKTHASGSRRLALPAALVVLYALSYPFLPPLLRAMVAVSAIGACLSAVCFDRPLHVPLWGLLLLSLPLIASFNFYLGYPLRVVVGSATAALLQMNGFAVLRDGTLLNWNGQTIAVDAPCSGVKMLWTGGYLCCTLAAFQGLDAGKTVLLCLLGLVVVIGSNILRASALFYVESGVVPLPTQWHAGVGVAIFVLTALAITALAQKLGKHHAD